MCRNRNCENFNVESALHDYCDKCVKESEASHETTSYGEADFTGITKIYEGQ